MSHEHHDHNPHQHNGPVSSSTHNPPPPPHGEDQPPVQASHAMAMEMYFHFGYENFVLFKQWSAVTDTTLFLTCLFYFVLAILYEVLKAYRRVVALRFQFHLQQHQHHHHHHHHRRPQQQLPHPSDPNGAAPSGTQRGPGTSAEPCETPIAIGERLSIADSCSVSEHGGGGNGHQKLIRSTMETMIGSSNNASGGDDDQQNGRSSTVYVVAENSKSKSKSKSNNEIDNLNGDSIATFVGFAAPYRSYGVCEHPPPENQDSTESSEIPLFSTIADMFSLSHLASTMLYMLQVLFAYLLMLAFMLFNVPICGAILAGAAVGHFVLAQKAIALQDSANEDYCH